MRKLFLLGTFVLAGVSSAETIRFTDGTVLEVQSLDVRESVVVFTTPDGKLHSVPRARIASVATVDPSVSKLIELAGLRGLIDDIARSAQVAAAGFGDGIVDAESLGHAMAEGFAREHLYAVATATFRERAAGIEVGPALEWLESPQAQGMRRVELAPSGASFRSFLQALGDRPPSLFRVELVMRLDRATGTTLSATEMQMALLTALLVGSDAQRGAEPVPTELLEGLRETLRAETESRLRLSLLYTYRDVPDDELARYVSHLESAEGAWIRDVLMKSVFTALQDGARRAGEIMARRIALKNKVTA